MLILKKKQAELIANLKKEGADMLIAINASPFAVNQPEQRKQIITEQAKQHQLPIVYVNAVGGQDDLVFDGGSKHLISKASHPLR